MNDFKNDIGIRSVKKITPVNVKKILLSEARHGLRTDSAIMNSRKFRIFREQDLFLAKRSRS